MFLHVQETALRSPDVVRFLRQILRLVPGELLMIWDGGPILRTPTGQRVHLERLPAYAPELNPGEGVWHYLKHVELRNLCCPTLWDLDQEVRLAARRLRRRPHVIRACFAQAGCV